MASAPSLDCSCQKPEMNCHFLNLANHTLDEINMKNMLPSSHQPQASYREPFLPKFCMILEPIFPALANECLKEYLAKAVPAYQQQVLPLPWHQQVNLACHQHLSTQGAGQKEDLHPPVSRDREPTRGCYCGAVGFGYVHLGHGNSGCM